MANDEHVAILKKGVAAWNAWRDENPDIRCAVLTGAVITETIFAWPGVGRLLIQSIGFRDYPLVQGCILLIAVTYVTVNLLTDLVYGVLDPRIRYE